jgi:meiotic recombination protein SPO11
MMGRRAVAAIEAETRRLIRELRSPSLVKRLRLLEILHLVQSTQISKKSREIYYMAANIFGSQRTVDRLIRSFAEKYGLTHAELGVSSALKGIFIGNLTFIKRLAGTCLGAEEKGLAPCAGTPCEKYASLSYDNSRENLIPDMCDVLEVVCMYETAVVIEKDTTFSKISLMLKARGLFEEILFICGKGYPCRNTLLLTRMLQDKARIYGLFDFDPYGLHIYTVYKHGSASAPGLKVEAMKRMGLGRKDVEELMPMEDALIPLSASDLKMMGVLGKYKELECDIAFLRGLGRKVEIEALLCNDGKSLETFLITALKSSGE